MADFYHKGFVFWINTMTIVEGNVSQKCFNTTSANEKFFETITKIMIEFMRT